MLISLLIVLITSPLQKRPKKSIIYAVINLSPEICRKIKVARREAGLSQSLVAKEVGCLQSALSMFEQGDGTKLNDDVIRRLCEKFHIELPKEETVAVQQPVSAAVPYVPFAARRAFCPNPACPSNIPYQVEERTLLRPDAHAADPVGGKFCALCGEVLERACPNCGAPVHEGGICSFCGKPYVATLG